MNLWTRWLVAALAIMPGATWAEVCDKLMPSWNPADGPVNRLDSLALDLLTPVGGMILGLILLVIWSRSRLAGVSLAILAGSLAALKIAMHRSENAIDPMIYQASIAEGCRTDDPWLTVAVLAVIALYGLYRTLFRRPA